MYKNQLQELAQRSCFNLPSYTCIREGPDHAPRFKASVNFNGETFESPQFCSNLRLAEHSAAEAALTSLSSRHSLAARILDETGVYKNLLQDISQRVASPLPHYTTYRSGLGHQPVFTGTVELAGITFRGEPAKNKKQAEKNAALAAWLSLKQLAQQDSSSSSDHENNEEQEQIRIARALQSYRTKEKLEMVNSNSNISLQFHKTYTVSTPRPVSPTMSTSKILPLFSQKTASRNWPSSSRPTSSQPLPPSGPCSPEVQTTHSQRFPVVRTSPFVSANQCRSRTPYKGIAPPITIRTTVPVFSAPPPLPPPLTASSAQVMQHRPMRYAPPVHIRQAIPVFSAPFGSQDNPPRVSAASSPSMLLLAETDKTVANIICDVDESTAIKCMEQLEI